MLKHIWQYGILQIPPKWAHFGGGDRIFRFFIQFLSNGLNTWCEGNIEVSRNSYPIGWPIGRLYGHSQPITF